jgi:hypothetical protein
VFLLLIMVVALALLSLTLGRMVVLILEWEGRVLVLERVLICCCY